MAVDHSSAVVITCDTCGAKSEPLITGATSARIALAAKGWRFIEWDVRGMNKYKKTGDRYGSGRKGEYLVPRQWDCCPACPEPADPHEAYKIRESRAQ